MPHKTKGIVWLLLVLLLISSFIPYMAEANSPVADAEPRNQNVRVHLTRLGLTDRLHLLLLSPYQLTTSEKIKVYFDEGADLAILLRNNTLYVHYENMAFTAGQSLTLQRAGSGSGELVGFIRTNFPAVYMGDLQLDVVDNRIRPILNIHVEDYLLGVVPHEMSEDFPLEALKAQAIAARTYALRKQDAEQPYDLVDTTNDQVFKGYLPGNPNTEMAIAQTRGECGFYKGRLAQCYYSASNGGQMELVQTVWPTSEDFGYYSFGADPYDVENPASTVRSFAIEKKYRSASPYALRELVAEQLKDVLVSQGFDPAAESIQINQVLSATLSNPVAENSILLNNLKLEILISGRNKKAVYPPVDQDPEEVSLFLVNSTPTTAPLPTEAAMPKIVYGPYVPMSESFTIDIPVFPTAERIFSMDISTNYENEIWSIRETDDAFILEARRYGHGVGMSQRGAQWMAQTYGKNYREILGFYYPGMELKRYPQQHVRHAEAEQALTENAGPAPSPTPRPTLMPTTLQPQGEQWVALVTEIDADSSLNLRAQPYLNADILMRLYKNQRLLVIENCTQEGWVKVRTDVIEGYVMEKYLSAEK